MVNALVQQLQIVVLTMMPVLAKYVILLIYLLATGNHAFLRHAAIFTRKEHHVMYLLLYLEYVIMALV